MNHTVKKLPKSQIEVTISLSGDEFKVFKDRALKEFAQKIDIEGFRTGKAPEAMVKEKIGAEALTQAAVEKAVEKHWYEIAHEEDLDIVGFPDAKIIKADDSGLEFSIIASLIPDVKLPDYKAIASKVIKTKKEQTVEEKEIDESMKWLRDSRAAYVTVTREAKKGDRAEVDFTVKDNGVVIEGGTSKNHPLIIGEGRFVPGFEDELVGMKEKDEKNFQLTMPKDYPNNLGGKKLDFTVAMRLVQEKILPELDDNFVKGLGTFKTVEELTKSIRDGILQEKNEKEKQRIDMDIATAIAEKADIDLPEALIESELDKMMREFQASIGQMGMEFEKYLEHLKKSPEDLKKEWRKDAEKRVRIALSLRAIAKEESIEPTDEEVEMKANRTLERYKADGHDIEKINKPALADYARNILRNEKVFEFLENQK